ncbi:hypothetical protein C8R47DRAFT_1081334 [Mycena vitilis]|nr:hypothetical protein C8R47DRAFT_1081334 [Mycena vitilis]
MTRSRPVTPLLADSLSRDFATLNHYMPDSEILHSGQQWQIIRQRAKERKAARADADARSQAFNPTLSDGGQVYTFVPGRRVPFVTAVSPTGRVINVPACPSSTAYDNPELRRRLRETRVKRRQAEVEAAGARASQLQAKRDAEDAALLARLKAPRQGTSAQTPPVPDNAKESGEATSASASA